MQIVLFTSLAVLALGAAASPAEQQRDVIADWWENAVFYQIYPRSFKDSNGDGIGDLRGIIEKLDYLEKLKVDGVWLSPIYKSPMVDFGYDVEDFYAIDSIFGTMADLEELIQKADDKGIKIILDFVPNHSSDQCEWFKKSVAGDEYYKDFYIWADGKTSADNVTEPPNNWVSLFRGSAWTWNEQRQQYYFHQFAKEQPDLNYRNPNVVKKIIEVLEFWLDKGVGGFRLDAINHLFEYADLRDEPLSNKTTDPESYDYTLHHYTADLPEVYEMVYLFRKVCDNYQSKNGGPTRILMSEAYTNSSEYKKYFVSEFGDLGSQMPFNFVLIEEFTKDSTARDLKEIIDKRIFNTPSGFPLNWVIGNHDKPRMGSRFGDRKIDGLLTLVMTLPGIAITYYGEEIGMLDNRDGISYEETRDPPAKNVNETDNWRELSRDPVRTPFQWNSRKFAGFMPANVSESARPWLPVHPNYRDVNVAAQKDFSRSTLKFYKQLLDLRSLDAFAIGSFQSVVLNNNVFAYVRAVKRGDTFVVLINLGAREETINISSIAAALRMSDFGDKSAVVAAGADSCYWPGDIVRTSDVLLRKYDAVILKKADENITTEAPIHDGHDDDSAGGGSAAITNCLTTIGLLSASIGRFFAAR